MQNLPQSLIDVRGCYNAHSSKILLKFNHQHLAENFAQLSHQKQTIKSNNQQIGEICENGPWNIKDND